MVYLYEPLIIVLSHLIGMPLGDVRPAAMAVGLSLGLWGVSHRSWGYPVAWALGYPVSIALVIWLAWRSLLRTVRGQAT